MNNEIKVEIHKVFTSVCAECKGPVLAWFRSHDEIAFNHCVDCRELAEEEAKFARDKEWKDYGKDY